MAMLPEERSRLARIVDMIGMISAQPRRWTRVRLAGHYEVSERMIQSDLKVIREELSLDVKTERGLGYYFGHVPQLPAVSYSLPEAVALLLAAQSARQLGGVSRQDLSSAIARLSSVIPPELSGLLDRLDNSTLEAPEDAEQNRLLVQITQAISLQQQVRLTYAAASHGGTETVRTVDPYGTIPYDRSWHLIGYCHLRDDIRVFKVDRIRELSTLDATFERDETFDLDAFLNEGWGLMRGVGGNIEHVVLKIDPPAAQWIAEDTWHPSQKISWRSDGSLIFRVAIQITPEFQRWVFHWGRLAEVIEPEGLREWVMEEAKAVLGKSCEN